MEGSEQGGWGGCDPELQIQPCLGKKMSEEPQPLIRSWPQSSLELQMLGLGRPRTPAASPAPSHAKEVRPLHSAALAETG